MDNMYLQYFHNTKKEHSQLPKILDRTEDHTYNHLVVCEFYAVLNYSFTEKNTTHHFFFKQECTH